MIENIKPEAKAEVILWDWLRKYGEVYFNRKNVLNWQTFRVEGESTEIPDFLFVTELFGKSEVFAIEIKDGETASNVRDAGKIFSSYLLNYYNNKTKYLINDKEVKINRFLVATQYSPYGRLPFKDFIQENGTTKISCGNWLGKVVPKIEYVRTKDFGRQLIKDYSDWRKLNKIREAPSLGWITSDVLFNFTSEELETLTTTGKPLLQGVSWNTKLNRWSQFSIIL